MISGYDVVPVRKTADLAPSAVTATCEHCGKTIGKTRASSGADLWITEGAGGVLCPNADASISQGHRPKTARSADNYTICGHDECTPAYMAEHGDAESHKIHRDKKTPQGWIPNPHTHEEWKGNAELERQFKDDKTSSLTVTAKEVGYYVVSRNGVPISGPYATRSDAAPNMIEQRGAAVMFIGPGNSAEWDALKAKQFPFGLNTVNGSRHTAWGPDQHNPEVGLDFHEFPEDPEYIDPRDYEDDPWSEDDGDEDDIPQRWEASRHTAGTMADGKTPVRQHKFKEDSNWGDESGCTVCGQSKGHGNHTDRAQATASGKLYDVNGKYASCSKCDYTYTGQDHADAMSKINQHLDDKHNGGWSTSGSMEERYATVRRLGSLRHFAEDEDDLGYEKQPKGLGDQVDTGMAPASEIQDPNPLAGQDLERTPRNLAEAALWAQAGASCEQCGAPLHSYQSPCPNCDADPDYPQDTPHDQLDDPWNGQENPLGRGWGDPPLGY